MATEICAFEGQHLPSSSELSTLFKKGKTYPYLSERLFWTNIIKEQFTEWETVLGWKYRGTLDGKRLAGEECAAYRSRDDIIIPIPCNENEVNGFICQLEDSSLCSNFDECCEYPGTILGLTRSKATFTWYLAKKRCKKKGGYLGFPKEKAQEKSWKQRLRLFIEQKGIHAHFAVGIRHSARYYANGFKKDKEASAIKWKLGEKDHGSCTAAHGKYDEVQSVSCEEKLAFICFNQDTKTKTTTNSGSYENVGPSYSAGYNIPIWAVVSVSAAFSPVWIILCIFLICCLRNQKHKQYQARRKKSGESDPEQVPLNEKRDDKSNKTESERTTIHQMCDSSSKKILSNVNSNDKTGKSRPESATSHEVHKGDKAKLNLKHHLNFIPRYECSCCKEIYLYFSIYPSLGPYESWSPNLNLISGQYSNKYRWSRLTKV